MKRLLPLRRLVNDMKYQYWGRIKELYVREIF